MYSQYNPANYNPNVDFLPANTSGKALNDNYFRPLPGLGALRTVDFAGNSNYNSLQVTVRRNFTQRLSYGLAYTFSKTMSAYRHRRLADTRSPYFPDKFRNYGPSYSPTPHVLVVNYVYELPNPGQDAQLQAARLGHRPLDHLRHHAVAQRYPRRRSRHFVLRNHLHQPADELDRRRRSRPRC